MFINISDVKYEEMYKLHLVFNNGVAKTVDLQDELSGEVFEPLRDLDMFKQVTMNHDTGTVEWPNGADFAPEFLYEIGKSEERVSNRMVAEEHIKYGTAKK